MSPFEKRKPKAEMDGFEKDAEAPEEKPKAEPPKRLYAKRNFAVWNGPELKPYTAGDEIDTDNKTAENMVRDGQAEWR